MYKVKLTEFVNKMNLKSLLPDIDTDSIMIEQSAVNRLALQLAGFFEHFDSERIQVIGNVEAAYMKQLAPESIPPLCEKIFSFNIPCLVFCRGLEPSQEMLDTAEKERCSNLYNRDDNFRFYCELCTLAERGTCSTYFHSWCFG